MFLVVSISLKNHEPLRWIMTGLRGGGSVYRVLGSAKVSSLSRSSRRCRDVDVLVGQRLISKSLTLVGFARKLVSLFRGLLGCKGFIWRFFCSGGLGVETKRKSPEALVSYAPHALRGLWHNTPPRPSFPARLSFFSPSRPIRASKSSD